MKKYALLVLVAALMLSGCAASNQPEKSSSVGKEEKIYVPKNLDDCFVQLKRQLKPEARKDTIVMFDQEGFKPTSMIDVSDGLASELFHIAKRSKVGVLLFEDQVPLHQDSKMMPLPY